MKGINNIICLIIGFSFASCNSQVDIKYNYPNNLTISDNQGKPKDSLTFYYPQIFVHDSQTIKVDIDSFQLSWYSSALYSFKEPILYNYYLGHDIYRFLWLRSFHRPVVFILNKDKHKVWLTTKELNKQPDFIDEYTSIKFVEPKFLPNGEFDTTKVDHIRDPNSEIIKKADRKANIILNQTINLTDKEWKEFETLININSFWTRPFKTILQIDGAVWIIEGHLKNNYWFTNTDNEKTGRYLIKLSGLKEKIY